MVVELGLVGAISVMGAAVQLRFMQVFMQRLKEITQAEAQREQEREDKAAQRFTGVERDRLLWEKEHGNGRDSETLGGRRTEDGKLRSVDLETGLSTPDLKGAAAVTPPSFMPTLDFGNKATAAELSAGVIQDDPATDSLDALAEKDPELREKMKLLDEIRRVKQNIEALREHQPPRSASPTQTVYTGLLGADRSSSGRSRTNSRPLSTASMPIDSTIPEDPAAEATTPTASPTRPPRAAKPDPRHRTRSYDGSYALGLRPTMLDSSDEDPLNLSKTLKVPEDPAKMHWDQYTKDRSLFTPPAGISAPIPASDYIVPVSPAVQEALERRVARESAIESGEVWQAPPPPTGRAASPRVSGDANRHSVGFPKDVVTPSSTQRYPQAIAPKASGREDPSHRRQASGSTNVVVVPNPPKPKTHKKTSSSPPITPPPRVVTAGELDERHRQRMRALQRPISEREGEQAKLDEAKARWENSRRIERTVMERKEKEQRRTSSDEQQQVVEEEYPRRSGDARGRSDKVAEWQQRQSVVPPPQPRRRSTNQSPLQPSPVSPRFGNDVARSREGSMEIPPPPQQRQSSDRPSMMPAHDRRMSSRSLDAWNVYSSPGSAARPPPN